MPVLVHADRDADVVFARADAVGRQLKRGRRSGAAVVNVHERDAGAPQPAKHGIGIIYLEAAAESELHVGPRDASVGERGAGGFGGHVDRRLVAKATERVNTYAKDDNFTHLDCPSVKPA